MNYKNRIERYFKNLYENQSLPVVFLKENIKSSCFLLSNIEIHEDEYIVYIFQFNEENFLLITNFKVILISEQLKYEILLTEINSIYLNKYFKKTTTPMELTILSKSQNFKLHFDKIEDLSMVRNDFAKILKLLSFKNTTDILNANVDESTLKFTTL